MKTKACCNHISEIIITTYAVYFRVMGHVYFWVKHGLVLLCVASSCIEIFPISICQNVEINRNNHFKMSIYVILRTGQPNYRHQYFWIIKNTFGGLYLWPHKTKQYKKQDKSRRRVPSARKDQGAVSIRKTVLPGMAIPMSKIRRPNGRLIFNMEIAIRR